MSPRRGVTDSRRAKPRRPRRVVKKTKDEVGKSFKAFGVFPRTVVNGAVEPLDQELGLRSVSGWMVEGLTGEYTAGFGGEWGNGGCRRWWVWSSGVMVLEEWFEE